MSSIDYYICLECETPCYTFEHRGDRLHDILCEICGNDEPEHFALEEDLEAQAVEWQEKRFTHRRPARSAESGTREIDPDE